jgi:galactofuranosylgalactofuranosylrhamnosyl-N-acetylglucosaminyl-diphospho-decaprenol beta-1,5/1,6-galactofuranosyltransferase
MTTKKNFEENTSMSGEGQREKIDQPFSGAVSSFCLQHFLYTIDTLEIKGLILQTTSNAPVTLTTEGVRGSFSESTEGEWLSFDGIVNAFPVGTFARHTRVQSISLRGELEGDMAIQIRHVGEDGEHILYEETFSHRDGHWESPPLPIGGKEGRYYLSCRVKGAFSLGFLGWWVLDEPISKSSFMVGVITYQSTKILGMLWNLCSYQPLKELRMSLVVVDNGQTLTSKDLPNDNRLSLISQPNLGATAGCMRGLWTAKKTDSDYFIVIADDGMILDPEVLYRLIVLQSIATKPLAVGAMMIYLDHPTVLHEQGARVPLRIYDSMHTNNNRLDLLNPESVKTLFRDESSDYAGWWIVSGPTKNLPFLPAFFIYLADILQGILLARKGVQTIIPPHLFIWQDFGFDMQLAGNKLRFFDWYRNELGMRLASGLPVNLRLTISPFFKKIIRCLGNFDYERAEVIVESFEEAMLPSLWALDPIAGAKRIQEIRKNAPPITDFSGSLSTCYAPVKSRKRSRFISIPQRLLAIITVAGYLNLFAKSVAPDGGFVFCYPGDYDFWQWTGYKQLAMINSEKKGYLCQRSWKKMAGILFRTGKASLQFLLSAHRLQKEYQKPSEEYEEMWSKAFNVVEKMQ